MDAEDDLLSELSAATYGRLHPVPVGQPAPSASGRPTRRSGPRSCSQDGWVDRSREPSVDEPVEPSVDRWADGSLDESVEPSVEPSVDRWVAVADVLADPHRLGPLVEHGSVRFGSDDQGLVLAQVARETVATLAAAAVDLWVRCRRLLDLTAANVVLGVGEAAFVVGVRRVGLVVLGDDPLVGRPDVRVVDEVVDGDEMLRRLLRRSLGDPVPAGELPGGSPDAVAAIAAIIAAVRRLVRCGERHLWGTVALAAVNATTRLGHTQGRRADHDRSSLLAARPDLARTIELVTVDAGARANGSTRSHDNPHAHDTTTTTPTRGPSAHTHGEPRIHDNATTEPSAGSTTEPTRGPSARSHGDAGGPGRCACGLSARGCEREEAITFALRRTCCLLVKLPDGVQCGTCSLRDRAQQLDRMTEWHRQERHRLRPDG